VTIPAAVVEEPAPLLVSSTWEIPREQIILQDKIGEGEFGLVCRGWWRRPGHEPILAAIKSLREVSERRSLASEGSRMSRLIHLVFLLGYG
jgi:hypothetical protein